MLRIQNILLIFAFSLIIAGCNSNVIYEKNHEIEEGIWNMNNKLEFNVNIEDSLALNDFYLNVRNTNDYAYQNLYVFIKTILPTKEIALDTAELFLADDGGKWLGTGLGDIKSLQILFKKDFRFTKTGEYLFIIEHGMRKKDLEGIIDFGITIEKK